MKEFGKVDSHGDEYTIETGSVPAVSSRNVRVLSVVEKSGDGTIVWWAIDMGDKWVHLNGTGGGAASKILHDFGVSFDFEFTGDASRVSDSS